MKTAYATIKGVEVMWMFRKGQFKHWIEAVGGGTEASFVNRLFGVYALKHDQEGVTLPLS